MANRVIAVLVNGKIEGMPSGDSPVDAGGNAVGGANESYTNIDCSSNPNYPSSAKGDHLIVTVAGKIGGASGQTVEAGDMVICHTANAGGDEAAVGANFVILNKNIADTAQAIRKRYVFTQEFFLDGQNALTGALVMDIDCPVAGYLVASSIKMKSARTAGTIAAEPHINGTGLTPTGLDLLIDGTDTTKDSATVAYGTANYAVSAADTIGFLLSTSTYTPLANRGTLTLILEG
jgi:hypothetical protein